MFIKEKKGSKAGTIVLIHGNSSSSEVFHPLFESPIPYSLAAPDLPGHGRSDSYGEEDFTIEANKKILSEFISGINDEILLVGHSLGGHYAIEIAEELKNLKGLVVFGTPPLKVPLNAAEAYNPVASIQWLYAEDPGEEGLKAFIEDAIFQDGEAASAIKEDFKRAVPTVRSVLGKELANGKIMDEVEIFSRLEIPKFVLHATKDPFLNEDYLLELKRSLDKSFEYILIQDSGHYPSLEKADEFNKIIKQLAEAVFLSK